MKALVLIAVLFATPAVANELEDYQATQEMYQIMRDSDMQRQMDELRQHMDDQFAKQRYDTEMNEYYRSKGR